MLQRIDHGTLPSHLVRGHTVEWEGKPLVAWLNEASETESHRWIADLLADIHWILRAWIPATEFGISSSGQAPEGKTAVTRKEWGKRYRRIQRRLRTVKMWPVLSRVDGSTDKVTFNYGCGDNPEARAVLALTRLGEHGVLHLIRCCAHCGKWFCARFRHQLYCSPQHQQSHYRSSEDWKEHRRKYMRGYRKLVESEIVKQGKR